MEMYNVLLIFCFYFYRVAFLTNIPVFRGRWKWPVFKILWEPYPVLNYVIKHYAMKVYGGIDV
jgi:hypothetical protein